MQRALKLREFAAAGNAIIAADLGKISATIEDGDDAVIVEAGTPDALGVVALGTDATRRTQLGQAARLATSGRFGMQRVLDPVEERIR